MRARTAILLVIMGTLAAVASGMTAGMPGGGLVARGVVAEGTIVAFPAAGTFRLDNGILVDLRGVAGEGEPSHRWRLGERIRVVGRPVGDRLVASAPPRLLSPVEPSVRTVGQASRRDGSMTVTGTVTWVGSDGFGLQTSMRLYSVAVSDETAWEGVEGLDALQVGDDVEVVGTASGMDSIDAVRVTLLGSGGGDDGGGGDGGDDGGGDSGGSGGGGGDDDGTVTVQGTVTWVSGSGFGLQVSMGMSWTVSVSDATAYDGIDGIGDLVPGDEVEVRGTEGAMGTLDATLVRRLSSENEITVRGMVVSILGNGFTLRDDRMTVYEVSVDSGTEWEGIAGLDELDQGDRVEVTGVAAGTAIQASEVVLLDHGGDDGGGGGGGGCGDDEHCGSVFESAGKITSVGGAGPDWFWMDDGRRYTVDEATEYDPVIGGPDGLVAGLFVHVHATYRHGMGLTALEIEYIGDQGSGEEYVDFSGTVASVSDTELVLDGGQRLLLTGATQYEGDADGPSGIGESWSVSGRALLTASGDREAVLVRSDRPGPPPLENQEYVPHEALVIPAAGANLGSIAARHGAALIGTIGSLAGLFRLDEPLSDTLLSSVEADPDVVAVEPNYLFRDPESGRKRYPIVDRSPTSEEFNAQPALALANVPAPAAGVTGDGMVVAVMDTGVDPFHPALRHAIVTGGLDLVDGDTQPWETRDGVDEDGDGDVDEAAGHGTFVASIVRLIAPGARILPYRVLDDDGGGTAYELAVALADAIERRVDVINLSLTYHDRSRAVDELLVRAAEAGIVVVAAAGNDGEAALPFPATDGHVIAVGALDADGTALAAFSDGQGAGIMAAPGTDVYGALDQETFGTSTGTSMAAPFVAAAAALALEADPTLDPAVLATVFEGVAVPLPPESGGGLRLNIAAALALVAP